MVNPFAKIGEGCIINTKVNVDHDSVLEDGVHLAMGFSMGGTVHIGMASWIGVGSSIGNNITIGAHVKVPVGSVVTENIIPQ